MTHEVIRIAGACQHNLKNLNLEIPRNRLVVITGLSGSGKSSLAFDTLFAEGQRKYVESLSAYARQFLDQMQKPEVDYIEGLSPAIAIEQRTSAANPRSTIATTTEIHDYARLLYSSVGQPHDPMTGEAIEKLTPQQIVDRISQCAEGTRLIILAPLVRKEKGEFRDVIDKLRREGFVRARIDGAIVELGESGAESLRLAAGKTHTIEAVVDRIAAKAESRSRLADSVETALRWGGNRIHVLSQSATDGPWTEARYSTDYCNPNTDFSLPPLTPKHFSFNSPLGACPVCHGLGSELVCDAGLMVPDATVSLADGAVAPWRRGTRALQRYYRSLLEGLAKAYHAPLDIPFADLPGAFKEALFQGTDDRAIDIRLGEGPRARTLSKRFEGLVAQMQSLYERSESEATKSRIRAFMSRQPCLTCNGARLRPEILAVTISAKDGQTLNIRDFARLPISSAVDWVGNLDLTESQVRIAAEITKEIRARLGFLCEVGLGYLTLDRESGTLSGGEAQRIRLATQIGSGLAGVLYVLDEPSIGLHQRDNDRLIQTLFRLRDLGNSVIVVEHDEDTIRAADHVIDMGPGAGPRGGQIVAQGTLEQILPVEGSLTAQFLSRRATIHVPKRRIAPRTPTGAHTGWLIIEGAAENNLKNIDAAFPLGCMTCVTGVSGSGKSTLVDDILRRALFRHFYNAKERPGKHSALRGLDQLDKAVVIDQAAIGRTPRSNPATYTGAFGPIREMFAQLPLSRVRGYGPGRFSFNLKGGRCENCQGDGLIRIEMHFLADVYVECEVCRGSRYNRETLEITYKGQNIADVLNLTIDDACGFFRTVPAVADRLFTLADVGLGYLRLGQPGNTLSGGEAQRVKLAGELSKKGGGRCVYLLDEPTTGLHFADIQRLLEVLLKLRNAGNTLIIIEHNLEVIKCADWILDLGPEAGDAGGQIVAQGTPEAVAADSESHTAVYLKKALAS
jgi:excinuclease ABC subunit A